MALWKGRSLPDRSWSFIRYHAMRVSINLAEERGPFPGIKGSIYDPENLTWKIPTPLQPYTHDYGRPTLDWNGIRDGILKHGIRNATQVTIAPTGTRATVANCEGYGCEPIFALAYTRYVVDTENPNHDKITLHYASPLFEAALKEAGYDDDQVAEIAKQVSMEGTCQTIEALPEDFRYPFVVSGDITPEEHVRMQASLQPFVDSSISKTINMPETATEDDVKRAYMLAWKLGTKGLTVYVTGKSQRGRAGNQGDQGQEGRDIRSCAGDGN